MAATNRANSKHGHGAPGVVLFAKAGPELGPLLATNACACAVLDFTGLSDAAAGDLIAELRGKSAAAGTAILAQSSVDAAEALPLDGVHLDDPRHSIRTARERLGRAANVGAGPAATRHEAMLLGEQEPDYVLLAGTHEKEWFTPGPDFITWWAELFEVPCIAFAEHTEDALQFAAAGADFIGLGSTFIERPTAAEDLNRLVDALEQMTMAPPSVGTAAQ